VVLELPRFFERHMKVVFENRPNTAKPWFSETAHVCEKEKNGKSFKI
jgi:hypothetical protein